MSYKIYIILVLGLNTLFSQSFFNKVIGNEIGFQSARSFAMGQTHFLNSNTSALTLRNPAQLVFLDKGMSFDFSLSGFMANERRAIDLKDFFGDFLVEGDYVVNNNLNSYSHFGFILNDQSTSFAFSYGPWSSLDYYYKEEVRTEESFSDLVIGTRDPIEGYHILEHEGSIYMSSLAISLKVLKNISFGASCNILHKGSLKSRLKVEQLSETHDNLASVSNIDLNLPFNGTKFSSFSILLKTKNWEYSVGYEDKAFIVNKEQFMEGSIPGIIFNTLGLPSYINTENLSALEYINGGIVINKPEKIKFGVNHKIGSNRNYRILSIEVIQNNFLNSMPSYAGSVEIENQTFVLDIRNYTNNFKEFNLGLEYVNYDRILRVGLSYKEPSFKTLSPLTTFCFGTSKKVSNFIFDIAASYSYQKYLYPDLFPVEGDVRPDYDNVYESNWSLISTISYTF